jgi:hypothetical protein
MDLAGIAIKGSEPSSNSNQLSSPVVLSSNSDDAFNANKVVRLPHVPMRQPFAQYDDPEFTGWIMSTSSRESDSNKSWHATSRNADLSSGWETSLYNSSGQLPATSFFTDDAYTGDWFLMEWSWSRGQGRIVGLDVCFASVASVAKNFRVYATTLRKSDSRKTSDWTLLKDVQNNVSRQVALQIDAATVEMTSLLVVVGSVLPSTRGVIMDLGVISNPPNLDFIYTSRGTYVIDIDKSPCYVDTERSTRTRVVRFDTHDEIFVWSDEQIVFIESVNVDGAVIRLSCTCWHERPVAIHINDTSGQLSLHPVTVVAFDDDGFEPVTISGDFASHLFIASCANQRLTWHHSAAHSSGGGGGGVVGPSLNVNQIRGYPTSGPVDLNGVVFNSNGRVRTVSDKTFIYPPRFFVQSTGPSVAVTVDDFPYCRGEIYLDCHFAQGPLFAMNGCLEDGLTVSMTPGNFSNPFDNGDDEQYVWFKVTFSEKIRAKSMLVTPVLENTGQYSPHIHDFVVYGGNSRTSANMADWQVIHDGAHFVDGPVATRRHEINSTQYFSSYLVLVIGLESGEDLKISNLQFEASPEAIDISLLNFHQQAGPDPMILTVADRPHRLLHYNQRNAFVHNPLNIETIHLHLPLIVDSESSVFDIHMISGTGTVIVTTIDPDGEIFTPQGWVDQVPMPDTGRFLHIVTDTASNRYILTWDGSTFSTVETQSLKVDAIQPKTPQNAIAVTGSLDIEGVLKTDSLREFTNGNGVSVPNDLTIEGVLKTDSLQEFTNGNGVSVPNDLTIEGVLKTDSLREFTNGNGVSVPNDLTIEGVLKTDSLQEFTNGNGVSVPNDLTIEGVLKTDSLQEFTNGNGVSVPNDLTIEGVLKTDSLQEFTNGSGVKITSAKISQIRGSTTSGPVDLNGVVFNSDGRVRMGSDETFIYPPRFFTQSMGPNVAVTTNDFPYCRGEIYLDCHFTQGPLFAMNGCLEDGLTVSMTPGNFSNAFDNGDDLQHVWFKVTFPEKIRVKTMLVTPVLENTGQYSPHIYDFVVYGGNSRTSIDVADWQVIHDGAHFADGPVATRRHEIDSTQYFSSFLIVVIGLEYGQDLKISNLQFEASPEAIDISLLNFHRRSGPDPLILAVADRPHRLLHYNQRNAFVHNPLNIETIYLHLPHIVENESSVFDIHMISGTGTVIVTTIDPDGEIFTPQGWVSQVPIPDTIRFLHIVTDVPNSRYILTWDGSTFSAIEAQSLKVGEIQSSDPPNGVVIEDVTLNAGSATLSSIAASVPNDGVVIEGVTLKNGTATLSSIAASGQSVNLNGTVFVDDGLIMNDGVDLDATFIYPPQFFTAATGTSVSVTCKDYPYCRGQLYFDAAGNVPTLGPVPQGPIFATNGRLGDGLFTSFYAMNTFTVTFPEKVRLRSLLVTPVLQSNGQYSSHMSTFSIMASNNRLSNESSDWTNIYNGTPITNGPAATRRYMVNSTGYFTSFMLYCTLMESGNELSISNLQFEASPETVDITALNAHRTSQQFIRVSDALDLLLHYNQRNVLVDTTDSAGQVKIHLPLIIDTETNCFDIHMVAGTLPVTIANEVHTPRGVVSQITISNTSRHLRIAPDNENGFYILIWDSSVFVEVDTQVLIVNEIQSQFLTGLEIEGVILRNGSATLTSIAANHLNDGVVIEDVTLKSGTATLTSIAASVPDDGVVIEDVTLKSGTATLTSIAASVPNDGVVIEDVTLKSGTATLTSIAASVPNDGVVIEDVTLKSGTATLTSIAASVPNDGVVIEDVTLKSGTATLTSIAASVPNDGVVIEDVTLKSGTATLTSIAASVPDDGVVIEDVTLKSGTATLTSIAASVPNDGVVIEDITLKNGTATLTSIAASVPNDGVVIEDVTLKSGTATLTSIAASVPNDGVVIEDVTLKSGTIHADTMEESTNGNGVIVAGVKHQAKNVFCDRIYPATSGSGVEIDSDIVTSSYTESVVFPPYYLKPSAGLSTSVQCTREGWCNGTIQFRSSTVYGLQYAMGGDMNVGAWHDGFVNGVYTGSANYFGDSSSYPGAWMAVSFPQALTLKQIDYIGFFGGAAWQITQMRVWYLFAGNDPTSDSIADWTLIYSENGSSYTNRIATTYQIDATLPYTSYLIVCHQVGTASASSISWTIGAIFFKGIPSSVNLTTRQSAGLAFEYDTTYMRTYLPSNVANASQYVDGYTILTTSTVSGRRVLLSPLDVNVLVDNTYAVTIYLLPLSFLQGPRKLRIQDIAGRAGTYNITVFSSTQGNLANNKIQYEGSLSDSIVLSRNFAHVELMALPDQGKWVVVSSDIRTTVYASNVTRSGGSTGVTIEDVTLNSGSATMQNIKTTGSVVTSMVTVSTGYTVTGTDYMIMCDPVSASFAVSLPSAATVGRNLILMTSTNTTESRTVSIQRQGSDLVGAASDTYVTITTPSKLLHLISNGSRWLIVDERGTNLKSLTYINAVSYTMNSWQTVLTAVNMHIYPSMVSRSIRVSGHVTVGSAHHYGIWIERSINGGAYQKISVAAADGSRVQTHSRGYSAGDINSMVSIPFNIIDSPATTSIVTYRAGIVANVSGGGNGVVYVNRTSNDPTSIVEGSRAASIMVLEELVSN